MDLKGGKVKMQSALINENGIVKVKLNTITGQIWIVQWSTNREERFTYPLSEKPRIADDDKMQTGRFSLIETDNMYTFLMLDNIAGECYQVQWSFEEDERLVIPIPWN